MMISPAQNNGNVDETFQELLDDLVAASIKYADIRARWYFIALPRPETEDKRRTRAHNDVLLSLNILERYMISQNWDVSWRDEVGRKETGNERKKQGDYACYIAYLYAINER